MTVGVAVIGYGRMGLIHARNVLENPRSSLKYIVGSDEQRLSIIGNQFEGIKTTTDLSVVLNDTSVQGVIVCSPSQYHTQQVLQCLKAGKAVFCEKPIAFSEQDIKQCYDTAEELKLPLLCGYQRRFDNDTLAIKEMIQSKIGKVQLLRITSRDHPPPPEEYLTAVSSGSFFDDFSTHDVDIARWLTEEEPETVYATASQFLTPISCDDTAVLVFKFPSGALCIIDNSRQTSYGYDIRIEALGPNGMLNLVNPRTSNIIFSAQQGQTSSCAPYSFPERFSQAYKNELNHWLDIIDGKATPRITANDCIQAVRLTTRAQESRSKQISPQDIKPVTSTDGIYPTVATGETIGVIIFGTGRMGRLRASALASLNNVKVLYAFDIIEESVKAFARDFSCEGHVFSDEAIAKALEDSRVNTVFVSTTSSSHFHLIVSSLNAGKHVFCEKPLALTAEHTIESVQLANQKNLALYCGFHRRSDKNYRKLKESLTGEVQLIKITSRESSSLNTIAYLLASGGFLFDSVIHDFDIACYITGEYPIEVYCQGTAFNPQLKEAGDIDAVVVVLRFPSGIIATIDNHRNAVYGYDQRVEVHTSTGVFNVENLKDSTFQIGDGRGFTVDNSSHFSVRYEQAYRDETIHFISLLKGEERQSRSITSDYAITARLAEAAAESYKTGKTVAIEQI